MATLLIPGEPPAEWLPANGRTFTLAELQTAVHGDIEVIHLVTPSLLLVINEEGKRQEPPWPVNDVATALFQAAGGAPWDPIVGPAVLCRWEEMGEQEPRR